MKTDPNYGKLREPVQYITGILRGFNATSDGVIGNRSQRGDLPNSLDQPVFQPATVFSYYQPGYEVPGTGILGPAFGILSTSTTLRRANVANQLIYLGIPVNANTPTGTQLNLSSLEAQASESGRDCGSAQRAPAARHDVHAVPQLDHHRDERDSDLGRKFRAQAGAGRRLPGNNFVSVRHSEITIMATSRRDFLRTSACALGGMAMASSLDSFGIVHALTPQAATDYRALVCIFLNGGNDGNNMVVDLNQYNSYATARGVDLAIPQASLLPVSPVSGGSYGFHPNLTGLRDLL